MGRVCGDAVEGHEEEEAQDLDGWGRHHTDHSEHEAKMRLGVRCWGLSHVLAHFCTASVLALMP